MKTTKPLKANPKTVYAAKIYHDKVFAFWGIFCFLHPFPGYGATEAAHVLGRGMRLGKLRFASVQFARPLCHNCHVLVDSHKIQWPLGARQEAVKAFNEIAKTKIQVPTE